MLVDVLSDRHVAVKSQWAREKEFLGSSGRFQISGIMVSGSHGAWLHDVDCLIGWHRASMLYVNGISMVVW